MPTDQSSPVTNDDAPNQMSSRSGPKSTWVGNALKSLAVMQPSCFFSVRMRIRTVQNAQASDDGMNEIAMLFN